MTPYVCVIPNVYSKTEVQKELSAQNKKNSSQSFQKATSNWSRWVGFALYQFDSVSACGNVDSLQHL